MAMNFNASGDWLKRTSDYPNFNVFTVMFWLRVRSGISAWSPAWTLYVDGTNYMIVYAKGATYFSVIDKYSEMPTSYNLTAETWYHIAWPRPGDNQGSYYYYRLATANSYWNQGYWSETPSATSPAEHSCGGNDIWDEYVNGDIAALKIYSGVALSEQECLNESRFYVPLRTANLHIWSPFVEKDETTFRDYSGNGRNWTEGGSVVWADGPPIAWRPVRRKRIYIPGGAPPVTRLHRLPLLGVG